MTDDAKGKPCPICSEPMTDLSSQFLRKCTNGKCGWNSYWPLTDKQPPLITSSRDRRR